ncbi:MAG TPA: alternative ribosome rescue aminoacyl-tRNA hydrolase ArfB [Acetobacteraceae bacterium]|nr:alternative ribosome rescue aminoacyl-tRNA hydrolase ArfB [Acetobacteraceae bacterium]
MLRISDTLAIDERALTESFIRASGPGGQNVNKVATAVQLRLDLAASGLADDVRTRLKRLAGKRLTQAGDLLITAQRHRTQERNREAAMQTLIELIRRAEMPPTKRVPTKPSAAERRRRLDAKARRSQLKQRRAALPEKGE